MDDPLFDHQTVDDDLNVVFDVLLQRNGLREVIGDAVHPGSYIAALFGVFKNLLVFALSCPDNGGQNLNTGPLRKLQHLIGDLVDGLLADLPAAFGTVGDADVGPQQTHVVINLRDGAHG